MYLKQILAKRKTLIGWFTFFEAQGRKFELQIEFTDAFGIGKMLEASKTTKWKKHQQVDAYDDDEFAAMMAEKIQSWRGLTLGVLASLTNIDISGMDPEIEIEFNRENLLDAMKNIPGMANFCRITMMEISNYRRLQQDTEVKNSESTPGSVSG